MSEDLTPYRIEPIALSNESTVVAEFLPDALGVREAAYQSISPSVRVRKRTVVATASTRRCRSAFAEASSSAAVSIPGRWAS